MGAWTFVHGRLHKLLGARYKLRHVEPRPVREPGDRLQRHPPVGDRGSSRPLDRPSSGLSRRRSETTVDGHARRSVRVLDYRDMSIEHIVVDGSNIATEGRSLPSLEQLEEAVTELRRDHPDAEITVVVDATFAHRIDPAELPHFEEAVLRGEYVSSAGGCDRARRRVLVAHRGEGRRHGLVERLVPGVPRRAPMAVRAGPSPRRDARSRDRVDLQSPATGSRSAEPSGGARDIASQKARDEGDRGRDERGRQAWCAIAGPGCVQRPLEEAQGQ